MPFYEFECPKGHITERMRSVDDREATAYCDACADRGECAIARRILSPTPTTFVSAGGRKL